MTAEERGMALMSLPMNQLPPLALSYLKDLCFRVGMCGEVCLTAYITYAQLSEGLVCTDTLYLPDETEKLRYKKCEERLKNA